MTYTQIIDKVNKVFRSCENKDQVRVARKYCYRLISKHILSFNGCDIDWGKMELLDYVDKLYNELSV